MCSTSIMRILIQNAIRWALGEPPRVEVKGQGVLDIATVEGGASLAVHLVNPHHPMMMKGPIAKSYLSANNWCQ